MPIPKEDWDKLHGSVEAIKNANCNAAGVFENNSVTVDDIRVKYKDTPDDAWLKPVDEKILASNPDECCGLSGEALTIVEANPPITPPPTIRRIRRRRISVASPTPCAKPCIVRAKPSIVRG